jgi:DNA modification methylase
VKIIVGDARNTLAKLPDQSVHCCVTSPPYWGLRDYGHPDQIGLEPTPEEYVQTMVDVFREVRRVLRDDGTLWLNLGDSYASGGGQASPHRDSCGGIGKKGTRGRQPYHSAGGGFERPSSITGSIKPKDLVGIPWRVAFALQADGWYLRQDIIWHKPSPMPESVTDRCTKAHEYVFLLTKRERYFYDAMAIAEAARYANTMQSFSTPYKNAGRGTGKQASGNEKDGAEPVMLGDTRNRRSVWTISTRPCKEAHFAVMPPDLAEVCILAGTSAEGCCAACGAPWQRVVERERVATRPGTDTKVTGDSMTDGNRDPERHVTDVRTVGWERTCECDEARVSPCTVLDPFGGAGTTALVSQLHERDSVICELNEKYAKIAQKRIGKANPMFTTIEVVQ